MPFLNLARRPLPEYEIPEFGPLISRVYGDVDPDKLTVFVPVKNEMALLPQFLTHYRRMGFEQFLVYDDKSDDGTFDYLRDQPDCVVIHTRMTFGEMLRYTGPSPRKNRKMRFGTFIKMAAPPHFLPGRIVTYVDADEFLLLPPGVTQIREVYDRIDAIGSTGAMAAVVEFFPRSVASFSKPMPETVEGLFEEYGWFEAEPVIDPFGPLGANGAPPFLAPSKSMRLFADYGIDLPPERASLRQKIYLSENEKRRQQFSRSARHKTPILRNGPDSFLYSAHNAIKPPAGEIMLTLAHFVFTANFARKIESARAWKSHAQSGRKYAYYTALLEAMAGKPDGFLTERSQFYEGPEQMIAAGLMNWPDAPSVHRSA